MAFPSSNIKSAVAFLIETERGRDANMKENKAVGVQKRSDAEKILALIKDTSNTVISSSSKGTTPLPTLALSFVVVSSVTYRVHEVDLRFCIYQYLRHLSSAF